MIKKVVVFFSLGAIVTGILVGTTSFSNNNEQIIDHGGLYGDDSNVIYPNDIQDEEIIIECE